MSFKAIEKKIEAKEGVSSARAGAILAAGTRRAGPAARKKNPKLDKVKGKAKPMHRQVAEQMAQGY